MHIAEHNLSKLDQMVEEISSILAQGYLDKIQPAAQQITSGSHFGRIGIGHGQIAAP